MRSAPVLEEQVSLTAVAPPIDDSAFVAQDGKSLLPAAAVRCRALGLPDGKTVMPGIIDAHVHWGTGRI